MLTEDLLTTLTDSELRLYLLLVCLGRQELAHALSPDELARRAVIPVAHVGPALATLAARGQITLTKDGTQVTAVGTQPTSLSITEDTAHARATLEQEARELAVELAMLRRGETSGLADLLPNEHGTMVRVAESVLGRALSTREIYHLGELVSRFGPARVKQTLLQRQRSRSPLKATYAILNKGGKGAAFQKDSAQTSIGYHTLHGSPWENEA